MAYRRRIRSSSMHFTRSLSACCLPDCMAPGLCVLLVSSTSGGCLENMILGVPIYSRAFIVHWGIQCMLKTINSDCANFVPNSTKELRHVCTESADSAILGSRVEQDRSA